MKNTNDFHRDPYLKDRWYDKINFNAFEYPEEQTKSNTDNACSISSIAETAELGYRSK